MKLTEKHIIKMFRQQTQNTHDIVDATEATAYTAASDARLEFAERVASDATSAQVFQQTYQLKAWSQAIGKELQNNTKAKTGLLDFFKPLLFATAMASAVWLVLPTHQSTQQLLLPAEMQTADSITDNSFDASDIITNNSFGGDTHSAPSDSLFDHSFS